MIEYYWKAANQVVWLPPTCTVVVVNQCTVAWVPASALAGTVVWEHWSTAPRAPAGSSGWAPGNTPALVLH